MENSTTITLVDNTIPADDVYRKRNPTTSKSATTKAASRISRHSPWSKTRKYAKWQPDEPGISADVTKTASTDESSSRQGLSLTDSNNAIEECSNEDAHDRDQRQDQRQDQHQDQRRDQGGSITSAQPRQDKRTNKVDVLYENQRGWFVLGIPFYSSLSLLQSDPEPWVTRDFKDSPVNITNAQVPDPSWEWASKTWYVDMSGDVDDQGWQYSLYFGSSSWHGTQPWFHSFVRRRRWLRPRVKRPAGENMRGRSGLERAHMLNEDYFTIHSSRERRKGPMSVGSASGGTSSYWSGAGTNLDEDTGTDLEEIGDIPMLMNALKHAIVDREKIEHLKSFVENGGEELYYLNEKMPQIMSFFIFQNSRWQFLAYLSDVINELSDRASKAEEDKEKKGIQQKHDNLSRAAEAIRRHITGPDLLDDSKGPLLNLTPVSEQGCSRFKKLADESLERRAPIKGIPEEAEIGREGHIY